METASNSEFKLVGSSKTEYPSSAVTLSCNLSPELSAVDLEIRWFKKTECVYLYKNRQVTEGKGYEDRVSLFRDELEKGNVSLQLKNCSWSDLGNYLCQVTDGDTTEELTVRMTTDPLGVPSSPLQRVFTEQYTPSPDDDITPIWDPQGPVSPDDDDDVGRRKPFWERIKRFMLRPRPFWGRRSLPKGRRRHRRDYEEHKFKLIGSCKTEYPSSAVTLSCNLSPELSAVDMLEIRWFKKTECVCLYKNRQVTEGKGYEDRVSLFRDELEKGNVSLQLKNCSRSDLGDYLCQVTDGDATEELTVTMMGDPLVPVSRFMDYEEPPLQRAFTKQTDRQWTNEERLKMEKSSLLIEYNSLLSEIKKKCSNLEKTQEELKNTKLKLEQVMETNQTKLERLEKELQDKNSQIQDRMIRQLQEKDRQLQEKDKQLQEKDKQLQEKDKQLQEKLQECTDPDPSVPIRRRNSIDTPPYMSGESSGDLEMEKLQQRLSELTQTHSVLEEVYERTVKSTAEAEGAAAVE